jgi:hypothetical protein
MLEIEIIFRSILPLHSSLPSSGRYLLLIPCQRIVISILQRLLLLLLRLITYWLVSIQVSSVTHLTAIHVLWLTSSHIHSLLILLLATHIVLTHLLLLLRILHSVLLLLRRLLLHNVLLTIGHGLCPRWILTSSFSLHHQISLQLFIHGCASYVWVSLDNLDCLFQSFQSTIQRLSLFSNSFWLSQLFGQRLILVDIGIQHKLESLLRGFHQEEPNCFGDGVSHISQNYLEICVNSCSDFLDEQIVALLLEGIGDHIASSSSTIIIFL